MQKKKKFKGFFPSQTDKLLVIVPILMFVFGTFMILSAEMGSRVGELSIVSSVLIRQSIFGIVGMFLMWYCATRIRLTNLRMNFAWFGYWALLGLLLLCRLFPAANGAYAWIRFGSFTIQPAEAAKVYVMILAAKFLGRNNGQFNLRNFGYYWACVVGYCFVILVIQHDLGSAVVLFGIAFVMALIPSYKELYVWQKRMLIFLLAGIGAAIFALSPIGTALFRKFEGNYMAGRFLAAADPFAYQYDTGYHVIMGMVSFATGGWFGLGYTESIHKYMNFPNPSTDFILPVIVEELGVVFGLLPILVGYIILFYKLIKHSLECDSVTSKMIFLGTFTYLAMHFVLNIGGVTGLIPLTGVPLLLISSGGSSLVITMMAIGICEGEIIKYKKDKNENSSRQV